MLILVVSTMMIVSTIFFFIKFSFEWDLTASNGAPIISEMLAKLLSLVYGGLLVEGTSLHTLF